MAEVTVTTKKQSILRLFELMKPFRRKYLTGLVLRVALSTTERVVIAFLAKSVIDAMTSGNVPGFQAGLIYWVGFYLAYVIVSPFVFYLWRSGIYLVTTNVREMVFKHLNRLPLGYHEGHHSGQALSVLTNDVTAAERAYQDDLLMLTEATAQGLGAVIAMMLLNWQLAMLVLLSGVAPLIVNTLFAKPLRKIGQQVQANLGDLSERMTDLLAGFQVVRTFNLGEWILQRFEQSNDQVLNSSMRRVRIASALESANNFAGLFNFLSIVAAAWFVLTGRTTYGIMIALIQLSNNVMYFVYTIGGTISRIQGALAAADRILEMLDAPLEPDSYAALPTETPVIHTRPSSPENKPAISVRQRAVWLRRR